MVKFKKWVAESSTSIWEKKLKSFESILFRLLSTTEKSGYIFFSDKILKFLYTFQNIFNSLESISNWMSCLHCHFPRLDSDCRFSRGTWRFKITLSNYLRLICHWLMRLTDVPLQHIIPTVVAISVCPLVKEQSVTSLSEWPSSNCFGNIFY